MFPQQGLRLAIEAAIEQPQETDQRSQSTAGTAKTSKATKDSDAKNEPGAKPTKPSAKPAKPPVSPSLAAKPFRLARVGIAVVFVAIGVMSCLLFFGTNSARTIPHFSVGPEADGVLCRADGSRR